MNRMKAAALLGAAITLGFGGAAAIDDHGHAEVRADTAQLWESLDRVEGHWIGELGGSRIEEVWLPRHGKNLTGCMRLYNGEDAVGLYELMSIVEGEEGLEFRLRHFGGEMNPWTSEVDAPMRYRVEVSDDAIDFVSIDEPKRVESIRYEFEGATLTSTISFPESSGRDPLVIVFERR